MSEPAFERFVVALPSVTPEAADPCLRKALRRLEPGGLVRIVVPTWPCWSPPFRRAVNLMRSWHPRCCVHRRHDRSRTHSTRRLSATDLIGGPTISSHYHECCHVTASTRSLCPRQKSQRFHRLSRWISAKGSTKTSKWKRASHVASLPGPDHLVIGPVYREQLPATHDVLRDPGPALRSPALLIVNDLPLTKPAR